MDLDDDSVDGVLCRWGYMLMSTIPPRRSRRLAACCASGGRLSFSVWAEPDRNPWAAIPGARARRKHGDMPAPGPALAGEFAMADRESGSRRSWDRRRASTRRVIEEVEIEWRFDDFDAYWSALVQLDGVLGQIMASLDERDRAQVCRTIEQKADRYREADGSYALPGVALNAVAS